MPTDKNARILYVQKLLLEQTDIEHFLTVQQIINELEKQGISAHRKTVISDIEQLIDFGMDIVCVKSTQNRYYVRSSLFSLSEIKLLVDAVEASQFITQSKSAELIGKLSDLTSVNSADKLCRQIYLTRRMKCDNEEIYEVVDRCHEAISGCKQVNFLYYEYDGQKNRVLRNNGERYQFSPYGMTWEDGRYYIIGYSLKHNKIVTFRVDRMSSVEVTDNRCIPQPDNFSIAEYAKKVIHMYDDENVTVTLKCKNEVMKSVIDRFGIDVYTEPSTKGYFKAVVEVSASRTFFGWVFQFAGDIKIAKPANVKNSFIEMVKQISEDKNN